MAIDAVVSNDKQLLESYAATINTFLNDNWCAIEPKDWNAPEDGPWCLFLMTDEIAAGCPVPAGAERHMIGEFGDPGFTDWGY